MSSAYASFGVEYATSEILAPSPSAAAAPSSAGPPQPAAAAGRRRRDRAAASRDRRLDMNTISIGLVDLRGGDYHHVGQERLDSHRRTSNPALRERERPPRSGPGADRPPRSG